MLFKAIALALSTLFIAAVQISAADAGCGGGHGGSRSYQSKLYKKQALQQSRARKAAQNRAVAAAKQKRKSEAVQAARIEKPAQSKTIAAESPAETNAGEPTAVASIEKSCTRFIAETGTTAPVECAKQ